MKYDPNYTYGDSEGEDDMADGDEEEDGDYEEDYAGSDDDDTSWKVGGSKRVRVGCTSREAMRKFQEACENLGLRWCFF